MALPEYKPRPVDTSAIELNQDLRANIEALARNNHEVWANARAAEGWKYGPERNDARKEHPGLVPYEQLSEAEKDIDRGTVLQTLKAAAALGFSIRRPDAVTQLDCPESTHATADDISEWPNWPPELSGDTIAELDKARFAISAVYESSNRSAGIHLILHKIIATAIAVCGTGAVALAILQLYEQTEHPRLAMTELVLACIASLAVFVGVGAAFMRRWLVQRHRAERCRFLKFDFLLEIALAGRDRTQLLRAAHKSKAEAETVELLEYEQIEEWLEEDQILKNPPKPTDDKTIREDLNALAGQYLRTRLAVQSRYFFRQSSVETRRNWHTQNLVPLLFGASICFVLAHSIVNHCCSQDREAGRFLVLLAALLPAFGAGIRGFRGIWEYSRNTLRFQAKHHALNDLIRDMEEERAGACRTVEISGFLWKGEQILEGEHREWLRLMMETEWIG